MYESCSNLPESADRPAHVISLLRSIIAPVGTETVRQKLGTAILVVNPEGKILMGERLGEIMNGFRGMPGGHVEIGESPLVGAKRELAEETGLDISGLTLIALILDHQGAPENDFLHFICLVKNVTKTPVLTEPNKCAGWEWYSPDNLPSPIVPAHLAAITYLASRQENSGIGFLEITTSS